MRAALLVSDIPVVRADVPAPVITGPGQVLLRNLVSTVCGSDVHIAAHGHPESDGSAPGFPGHETVGVVEVSSDPAFSEGDLVLAVPDLAHAGGFAEFQLLPASFAIRLAPGTNPETAVLAQQLGTVIYAMKRFWPQAQAPPLGGSAVVLGAGPVGLFFTRLCRLAGFATVIVSDLHPHRLDAARAMGATVTVPAVGDAVVDAVTRTTGHGANLVIEAAGTDITRVQSIGCVARDGRIGMFGMPSGPEVTLPFESLFRRRPTLEFCWGAQAEPGHDSFRQGLRAIDEGTVDIAPLKLTLRTLDEFPATLRLARNGGPGVIKAGIRFP